MKKEEAQGKSIKGRFWVRSDRLRMDRGNPYSFWAMLMYCCVSSELGYDRRCSLQGLGSRPRACIVVLSLDDGTGLTPAPGWGRGRGLLSSLTPDILDTCEIPAWVTKQDISS